MSNDKLEQPAQHPLLNRDRMGPAPVLPPARTGGPVQIGPDLIGRTFMNEILRPVWGELPRDAQVSVQNDKITISHTKYFGADKKPIEFRYQIDFEGREVKGPPRSSLYEVNKMTMPFPSQGLWSAEEIKSAQNTLRRLIIADPSNPRFQKGSVVLADYQQEAVEAIHADWDRDGKALVVKATATGKTVVGFSAIHQYLERHPGERGKPFVFIVNNNIILEEAEQKLKEMFPGRYKTSRVFDGGADLSGDVIFATPQSLLSNGRLKTLLNERGVAGLVFDETHHVPASTNKEVFRMVEEHSLAHNTNTKFLGMTATEVRPDRANVIKYFSRISYEYPPERGQQEGYLVPISYRSGDHDINPGGKRMLPGEPGYDEFRDKLYSDARFPHLAAQYKEMCTRTLDDRGLILAPSVERCQALAAYLRKGPPDGPGINAVSLTADDRTRDPVYFEHCYYAWKHQKWPEKSPYAGTEVPKVVVGVDIFKEGVDVPAINNLLLWADTNSIIAYTQAIGRGLRLAPFKTHLEICDAVGLFRKADLLPFLGNLMGHSEGSTEKVKKDPDLRVGRDEEPPQFEAIANALGEDVSATITRWYEDLSQRLHRRYEVYSEIPVRELLETLDPWLAKKFGFMKEDSATREASDAGTQAFYKYAAEFAEKLYKGVATPEEIQEFRARSIPAFTDHVTQHSETTEPLKLAAARIDDTLGHHLISYSRIFDVLNRDRPGESLITSEHINKVYPDFDPERRVHAEYRAKNLIAVRTAIFNHSLKQMSTVMIESLGTGIPSDAKEVLSEMEREVRGRDGAITLELAEGRYSSKEAARDAEEGFVVSRKENRNIDERTQIGVTKLYLCLDKLRGSGLTADDFHKPPKEFFQRLQLLGLVDEKIKPQAVSTQLRKLVGSYTTALENGSQREIAQSIKAINEIITQPRNAEIVRADFIGDTTLNNLLGYGDTLRKIPPEKQTDEHKKLLANYDNFLETAALRWRTPVEGLDGATMVVSRIDTSGKLALKIDSPVPEHAEMVKLPPTPIRLIQDTHFLPPHLCLQEEEKGSVVDTLAKALFDNERARFLDTVVDSLEKVAMTASGRTATLVIPKGPEGVLTPLVKRVVDTTNLDVLGPIEYERDGSSFRINFTFNETLKHGRYSFLTPTAIPVLRTYTHSDGGWNFERQFAYIYQSMHDFEKQLTPQWSIVRNKLEHFYTDDPVVEKQKGEILHTIRTQAAKEVTGPRRMGVMLTMMQICEHQKSDEPLTPVQIQLAHLMMAGPFNLTRDRGNAAQVGALCSDLYKERGLIQNGLNGLSPELKEKIASAAKQASEDYHRLGYVTDRSASRFSELNPEMNAHFSKVQKDLVATLSPDELPVAVRFGHKFPAHLRPPFIISTDEGSSVGVFIEPKVGKEPQIVHWDPVCPRMSDPEKVLATIFDGEENGIVNEKGYFKKKEFACCPHCRGEKENSVNGTPHTDQMISFKKAFDRSGRDDPIRAQWVEEAD